MGHKPRIILCRKKGSAHDPEYANSLLEHGVIVSWFCLAGTGSLNVIDDVIFAGSSRLNSARNILSANLHQAEINLFNFATV